MKYYNECNPNSCTFKIRLRRDRVILLLANFPFARRITDMDLKCHVALAFGVVSLLAQVNC